MVPRRGLVRARIAASQKPARSGSSSIMIRSMPVSSCVSRTYDLPRSSSSRGSAPSGSSVFGMRRQYPVKSATDQVLDGAFSTSIRSSASA